jgi:erythromycin esterase-like protein
LLPVKRMRSVHAAAARQHQLGKHLPRARGLASFSVGTPFHVKDTRHGSM